MAMTLELLPAFMGCPDALSMEYMHVLEGYLCGGIHGVVPVFIGYPDGNLISMEYMHVLCGYPDGNVHGICIVVDLR